MKITNTHLHTVRSRPWGWELPATFVDSDGSEYNEVLLFRDGEPNKAAIEKAAATRAGKLEAYTAPEPDEMLSKAYVEAILREKGYLTLEQEWESLEAKKELAHG